MRNAKPGGLRVAGRAATLAAVLLAVHAGAPRPVPCVFAEDPPSLSRALYLERTARDPAAALGEFEAVRAKPDVDAATRADAALGAARCLVALGRDGEAAAVWDALLADADPATAAAREEAGRRKRERERARAPVEPDPDAAAQEKARQVLREAEERKAERERRQKAATRLVESARGHLRAGRFDPAREDLIRSLELNPDDAEATGLLEEVSAHLAGRGDVLHQAIRFVASTRLADYRRLSADLDALRDRGKRALREGRAPEAARVFRDGVDRIDRSDFYADLADRRVEMVSYLRRALEESRAAGAELGDSLAVPVARPGGDGSPEAGGGWRSRFFALLGEIFSTRTDDKSPLRFYDAAAPFVADPDVQGPRFSSSGLPSTPGPGSLRRSRWLERYVQAEIAPGTWTATDRVLERYEDTLIVQHLPSVQRQVEALRAEFPPGAAAPVQVDAAVFAAKPGGLAEAALLLEAQARPSESGQSLLLRDRLIEEQVGRLSPSQNLVLLARASLVLARRHSQTVRLREPTSAAPVYRAGEGPRFVVPDRDAQYGLDLEVWAEDLPKRPQEAALSVVAVVRRPDRARVLPLADGEARVPVLLTQTVEADRIVPHAGSLALLGLSNPFAATGAAGDPRGGTHPDLVVLVAVRPAPPGGGAAPVPDVPPAPSPTVGRIVPSDRTTQEYDLGPLAVEVEDEPAPEDWPAFGAAGGCRPEAARMSREAFLAGFLAERAGLSATSGTVVVREGKALATLSPKDHARLSVRVEDLQKDEARLYEVDVRAAEAPVDRAETWLAAEGIRLLPGAAEGTPRVYVVEPTAARDLDARLDRAAEPGALYALASRVAARHTQLVTARALRVRGLVDDFRVVRRPDGSLRATPVAGTAEEGILVSVRPSAYLGGLTTLAVNVALARIDRVEPWRPADAPDGAPVVDVARHQVERVVGAQAALLEGQRLLLALPAPGSGGSRVVLIRAAVRSLR
jgi:tetratricopeptide (TPR) repeat protein